MTRVFNGPHRTPATAVKPRRIHRATTSHPHIRLGPRVRRRCPASAITFGEPDGGLHPNVGVVVIDRNAASPGPDITCSGTLISEDVFLTMAHCVDVLERVGQPYWVSFESTYDEERPRPPGSFREPRKHPCGVRAGSPTPTTSPSSCLTAHLVSPLPSCPRPVSSTS